MKQRKIIHGNSKEVLKTLPDNYFHSLVTDPPYEIEFMNKSWDGTGIAYDIDFWKECLRVLKPGGHLLSFSATSTYHKMATAIECAGFEIRDKIDFFYDGNEDLCNFINSLSMNQQEAFIRLTEQQNGLGAYSWIYGQGMPKGQNISKAIDKMNGTKIEETGDWQGYNTSLKPANEPICLARKPLKEKSIVKNVVEHGTGALNVDACRIKRAENDRFEYGVTGNQIATTGENGIYGHFDATAYTPHELGRYPANVMFDESSSKEIDNQSKINKTKPNMEGASRFFFCSKAKKNERVWEENLLKIKDNLTEEEKIFILQELNKLEVICY